MTDNFKTMKLVKKLAEFNDKTAYQGVFLCSRCHGVLINKGISSFADPSADEDSQIVNWPCPLCDAAAPLSRRYRMALCTVGWRCAGERDVTKTSLIGFPSFETVFIDVFTFSVYISLQFDYKGTGIDATTNDILPLYQSQGELFNDLLDGRPDQLTLMTHVDRQALARDVVDRVRHDLRLDYAKEA